MLTSWHILSSSGVPAVMHDWLWPADRAQIPGFASIALDAWHPEGLGAPAVYPNSWPIFLFGAAACFPFGTHAGIAITLLAILSLAFLGAVRLGTSLGGTRTPASIAAAIYAANPLILNEVHAGHLGFLLAYAIAPFAVASFRDSHGTTAPLRCGALIGVTCTQIQFVLLLTVALLFLGRRRSPRFILLTVACAIVIIAPEVTVAAAGGGRTSLDPFLPYPVWDFAQSSDLANALRISGYLYDSRLPEPLRDVWYAIPLLALLALFTRRRSLAARALLLSTLGVLATTGVKGPLAVPLLSLFSTFDFAAVFRELYNFNFLTILGYCTALLVALDGISHFSRRAMVAASLVFLSVAIAFASEGSVGIPMVAFRSLSGDVPAGRYLIRPSLSPWSIDSMASAGYVPQALLPYAPGVPANAALPPLPVILSAAALQTCDRPQAEKWLAKASIRRIITLPKIHSAFNDVLMPSLRGVAPDERGSSCDITFAPLPRFDSQLGRVAFGSGASISTAFVDPVVHEETLMRLSTSPDPAQGWSRTLLWPTLPAWMFAEPGGLWTNKASESVSLPASTVIAGSSNGDIRSPSCVWRQRIDLNFAMFRCSAQPTFSGSPPLVVARAFSDRDIVNFGENLSAATVRVLADAPTSIAAHIDGNAGSLLILRDAYDPGWKIDVPARHVRVDGFFNGWVLDGAVHATVRVSYGPTPYHTIALYSALLVFTAGMASLVLRSFRRNADPARRARALGG